MASAATPLNAFVPTEGGVAPKKLTEDNNTQFPKASEEISVTLLGIVTLVRLVQ